MTASVLGRRTVAGLLCTETRRLQRPGRGLSDQSSVSTFSGVIWVLHVCSQVMKLAASYLYYKSVVILSLSLRMGSFSYVVNQLVAIHMARSFV